MEEDEPDKMAIAAQRIGRLKRFIIRVIKGFFCGIKGALCFIFRCGKARVRETDMDLDILADKEFQVRSREGFARGMAPKDFYQRAVLALRWSGGAISPVSGGKSSQWW